MVRIPWNEVSPEDTMPPGFYRMAIENMAKVYSRGEPSKLMIKAAFRLTQDNPADKNKIHYENFVLGTQDDPDPVSCNPEEWGVKMLLRCFFALNMPPTDDLEVAIPSAIGKVFDAKVTQSTQKGGPYDGRSQNRIVEYYVMGTKQLGQAAATPNLSTPTAFARTTDEPSL